MSRSPIPEHTRTLDFPDGGWYWIELEACGNAASTFCLEYSPERPAPDDAAWALVGTPGPHGRSRFVLRVHPGGGRLVLRSAETASGIVDVSGRRIGRGRASARMAARLLAHGARFGRKRILRDAIRVGPRVTMSWMAHAGDVLWWYYRRSLAAVAGAASDDAASFRPDAACALRRTTLGTWRRTAWVPVNQLAVGSTSNGAHEFRTTGGDPQLRLVGSGMPIWPLPGGWYRFRLRVECVEGRIVQPCLYPDYGGGEDNEGVIALPEPVSGVIDCIVLLERPATGLRFDPTTSHACFSMHESRLERVARSSALLAMLQVREERGGKRDWYGLGRACVAFAARACRRGLRMATDEVRAEYQRRLVPDRLAYADWVARYDTFLPADLGALAQRAARCPYKPLISIILPVYDTPERWLRSCLESVLGQAYPHWELCIADDASPAPHVRRTLDEYSRRDPRIRVSYRDHNGHIAEASNTALGMARGEFVAFLDHDDELRPHALLEFVELIATSPDTEFVYSDEDKLDGNGRRCQPYFKPDWNPDLLLSQNYVSHFSMIRTALVRAVGGFRAGYEGSQDHDLYLRCVECLDSARIAHVPRVLYHWRAVPGSTALERSAKDYAAKAGVRAVADHLSRTGSRATVEELPHGHYRIRWALPDPPPRVSIIIPTRDRLPLLRNCVESVLQHTRYPDIELVVVDNQSSEPGTLAYLDDLRSSGRATVLVHDAPFNYSAINNRAVSLCAGQVLCLLNNDIEVISGGWLEEMVGQALRPGIGAVGAMLYYPDDTIQHAGVILGLGGVANHVHVGQPAGFPGHGARALVAQNMTAVTGACMVVRRDAYEQVGGLDERLHVAFNDIDFCLRLREAGYRNLWTPFARLYHHESASRGREDSDEKIRRFLGEVQFMEDRWGELLQRDPAYNCNFSLEGKGYELGPPRGGRPAGWTDRGGPFV